MTIISDFVGDRSPADLYEEYLTPTIFAPLAAELMARGKPSGHVLDVACGTGAVTRAIAGQSGVERIGAADIAPPMIEISAKMAQDHGYADRAEIKLASADDLPFEESSFDAAFCQQGLQFFPDRVAALNEVARVLKPGATLTAAIWSSAPDGNPVFDACEKVVAERLGDDLIPFAPFTFGDAAEIESVVGQSKLSLESLDRYSFETLLPDARTLILFDFLFLGRPAADGSMQPVVDPADPAGDEVVRGVIEDATKALASYRQSDGRLKSPMTTHILTARA